jgi:hypothetical protein
MRSKRVLVAAAMLLACAPSALAKEAVAYTADFRLQDCNFSDSGANPFFSLRPGHRQVLEGEEDGEVVTVEQLVLDATKMVTFTTPSGRTMTVRTRVVRETEWVDGELVEVSRNFFARCRETNSVIYFGETVDNYDDGEIVNHDGSWRAGLNGALPGMFMPGTFLLGSRYYQEVAPGVALDRGEDTAMGLTVTVPAGTFQGCVEVLDTDELSPRDPGDIKVYCPGVGIVADGPAQLVEFDN